MSAAAPTFWNSSAKTDAARLQCMTVWGGNSAISRAFEVPGLSIWVHSRVHGGAESGGDVYFISSCASGRVTRMLVADVSGHGATVAQTADSLRSTMSKNVNQIQQNRVVQSVNQEFAEHNDNGRFATALVGTFFAPSRKLTLSNAGHPPPLFFRSAQQEWLVQESRDREGTALNNLPLGIVPETDFDQSELRLTPGDMILLYTDAFYEAQDANGDILGSEGLRRIAQEGNPEAPERFIPELIHAISALSPENLAGDDATIVLMRAADSRTPLWNSLSSPFRYLGGLLGLRRVRYVESTHEAPA